MPTFASDRPSRSSQSAQSRPVQSLLHQAAKVVRAPGKPLDPLLCSGAEARFGVDFSHVRVHDDAAAAASAEAANARAYTVGSHIVFGRGEYRPHDTVAPRIVLHELVHVAQQGSETTSPRWVVPSQHPAEQEAHEIADHPTARPSWQVNHRIATPALALYPKQGQVPGDRDSEPLEHGQDPYNRPPKPDPLEPLRKEAREHPEVTYESPHPEPTIPGNDSQQQEAIANVDTRLLFEQPGVQQKLRAAAAAAEAREQSAGGKVNHTVDAMMTYWEDMFVDSVDYILYVRGSPRKAAIERLEKEEAALMKANPPDLIDQVETLRENYAAGWEAKVQLAVDRFVVLAENQAKFLTIHQNATAVRVSGLPDTEEPATSAAAHPGVIQKGSADVSNSVVTFTEAVQKESRIKAEAENYADHELGSDWLGGDPKHVGKYSFDVHLDGLIAKSSDGFYDRDAIIRYFLAVERASKATDIEWVAYYNDFEVAKAVNEQLGRLHVGYSGGGGKPPFAKGSFHHGPEPYVLHIHFNIMPNKLKEKFDQKMALRAFGKRVLLPFLQFFNPL
jgi:hypothetical protein